MEAIKVDNVSKYYGKHLILDQCSISIPQGGIYSLLGRNGAGKTTLLKLILGIIDVSSGNIFINHLNYRDESCRKKISYLPEKFSFYPKFTVEKAINFMGDMYGITHEKKKENLSFLNERLRIDQIYKKKIKNLSKGQLQLLGMSILINSNADIYILDEPFSGLDPIIIKDLKKIIQELKNQGKTVVLSSHILGEVEKITDNISIINEGKILASGNIDEINKKMSLEDFFYQKVKENSHSPGVVI